MQPFKPFSVFFFSVPLCLCGFISGAPAGAQPAAAPLSAAATVVAQFSPTALLEGVWPILLMLLGFSLIVFVHELGHFAVAKWAGVRVDRFAIGFGKELFGFTRGETRYSFNVLPLGGYVKMLGQEDFDDKANELKFKDDPHSFVNKPVGHRMAIVSAGVIMNVIFAFLLFMVVFMVGLERPAPNVGFVMPDSPADRAGLLAGDEIRRINGSTVRAWDEVTMAVMLGAPFEPIDFVVDRPGQGEVHLKVMPEANLEVAKQTIGILPGYTNEVVVVGGGADPAAEDRLRPGDTLVEVKGLEVTTENAIEAIKRLVYARGSVFVERKDPQHPEAPPRRLEVHTQPDLSLLPSGTDRTRGGDLLGLVPLVKFNAVEPRGPAYFAGLEAGDTVLMWNDVELPDKSDISRGNMDNAGRDVPFRVRKPDGSIREGFVRPEARGSRPGTLQARVRPLEPSRDHHGALEPRRDGAAASGVDVVRPAETLEGEDADATTAAPVLDRVRPFGAAAVADLGNGDVVLRWEDDEQPTAEKINRQVTAESGRRFRVTVRKPDGRIIQTVVTTARPGIIKASFDFIADDYPLVAGIVPTIAGLPSPAAAAGVPVGAVIRAVSGKPVSSWSDIIDAFRASAGSTVALEFDKAAVSWEDRAGGGGAAGGAGAAATVQFPVPHSIQTLLGLGPESVIVSIDGKTTVTDEGVTGFTERSVQHPDGTRAILEKRVGRTGVPVRFRQTTMSPIEEAVIDVTADMVDPWVRRINPQINAFLAPKLVMIREPNPIAAVQLGIRKTYYFVLQVYQTIQRMAFSKTVGFENISGPLGIVSFGAQVARQDFTQLLFFLGILSANLAVINFLPLPIVDGGLMVFLIIEKIKGTPVSLRVQVATQVIGLVLLVTVFVWVTLQDVMRIWG